jgi:hypothetical protein
MIDQHRLSVVAAHIRATAEGEARSLALELDSEMLAQLVVMAAFRIALHDFYFPRPPGGQKDQT